MNDPAIPLALALAGGNALGAFQGGALSELARQGLRATTVAGCSIGAVNAVLYLSPKNGDPEATLRTFWDEAAQNVYAPWRRQEEYGAAILSLVMGRPTLWRSRIGPAGAPFVPTASLLDTAPFAETLSRLVDFDALAGRGRLFVGAVRLDPDTSLYFDSAETALKPQHILASAALPVLYPPVQIGDHWYVDGGLSSNLPVEPLLSGEGPLDCIALDLFAGEGAPPRSLDAALDRLQTTTFALQAARSLDAVPKARRPIRVIYAPYRPPNRESALKSLDFSRRSLRERWRAGEEAMARALEQLRRPAAARPGVERL